MEQLCEASHNCSVATKPARKLSYHQGAPKNYQIHYNFTLSDTFKHEKTLVRGTACTYKGKTNGFKNTHSMSKMKGYLQ